MYIVLIIIVCLADSRSTDCRPLVKSFWLEAHLHCRQFHHDRWYHYRDLHHNMAALTRLRAHERVRFGYGVSYVDLVRD
jgi:hypothetical protein